MILTGMQPGYFPWLGFFEQLYRSDIFVMVDDAQYTKSDWRNRNRIKTKDGVAWLTVPVLTNNKWGQKIKDVNICNSQNWIKKHLSLMKYWYSRSPYYGNFIEDITKILEKRHTYLLDLDMEIIYWLTNVLGIKRKIIFNSSLDISKENKHDMIIEIAKIFKAKTVYEGAAGRDWMDTNYFHKHGLTIEFQDYEHPFYNQLWVKEQGFVTHLSILDLLFNHGPDSLNILANNKKIVAPPGIRTKHANEFIKGDRIE